MRAIDIIAKKRDGQTLLPVEINFLIDGYNAEMIPDYQLAAFLMAVYFQGMNEEETATLTQAMVNSGKVLDFSGLKRPVADKHSTGGVGDKTTLVLLPLIAACGVAVAKMSGRGLGHTGGTIDKLSCIPGFRTQLSQEEFKSQVAELGLALVGQSPEMTPADGKLYALRDVTATVDSIPLIAASVMSKKIAAGAKSIVLDVKCGNGAFMQEEHQAMKLAEAMVSIGKALGRETVALITAMDQPLGFTVGNQLEVIEAIETLNGKGPADLTTLTLSLAEEILLSAKITAERHVAQKLVQEKLTDGSAFNYFERFIAAQGGNTSVLKDTLLLGSAKYKLEYHAAKSGYLKTVHARTIGQCAVLLGAGRAKKDDEIDLLAGIRLAKKVGDRVAAGETLATLYASDEEKIQEALELLDKAYIISEDEIKPPALILQRVN